MLIGSGGGGTFLKVPALPPHPDAIIAVAPRMPIIVIRRIVFRALLSRTTQQAQASPAFSPGQLEP
jgi:hypothetical protein